MVLVYLPTKLGDFVGKLTFTGNQLYGLDNSGVFGEDFPNETSRRVVGNWGSKAGVALARHRRVSGPCRTGEDLGLFMEMTVHFGLAACQTELQNRYFSIQIVV